MEVVNLGGFWEYQKSALHLFWPERIYNFIERSSSYWAQDISYVKIVELIRLVLTSIIVVALGWKIKSMVYPPATD